MSTSSATPPATRRIAKSYLTDLIAAVPAVPLQGGEVPVMSVVEQLLGRAVQVRHVLRSDQLVLTFDLADDPAGWSTSAPGEQGTGAAVENRDYPGQPATEGDPWTAPLAGNIEVRDP